MTPERRRELNTLFLRFADGDRAAFQPLFDGLWPALLAFTRRALASDADAEDAAQQALLKVFSRIADFDRDRDGVSWAHGIAAFEVMTVRKQRVRRREDASLAGDVGGEAPDQEVEMARKELALILRDVLGTLSLPDRKALAPILEDVPAPTDETSRKRRFRALARLREAWRRSHG